MIVPPTVGPNLDHCHHPEEAEVTILRMTMKMTIQTIRLYYKIIEMKPVAVIRQYQHQRLGYRHSYYPVLVD